MGIGIFVLQASWISAANPMTMDTDLNLASIRESEGLMPRMEKLTVIKRSGNVQDDGSMRVSSPINKIRIVKRSQGQTNPPLVF